MRRYTTPTVELTVEGHDLTAASIYVTFRQRSKLLTIENPASELDGEDTVISVELGQLQTAQFTVGTCDVQVNWVEDGMRNATNIAQLEIGGNLLEEEV